MQPSVSGRSSSPACLDEQRTTEKEMHILGQGAAQAVGSIRLVVVLLAIAVVAFWRVVLRLMLALVTVVILVAVGYGILQFLHPGG